MMGVRVTGDRHAMYDSVTGVAFGPVFDEPEDVEQFLQHLRDIGERDPRVIPALELTQLRNDWYGNGRCRMFVQDESKEPLSAWVEENVL